MTLAKFGIQYSAWSDEQLEEFAEQRGVELPRAKRNRRLWIHLLRTKDKNATIPFLSFPAEIRNMVYTLLLTPEDKDRYDGRDTCHPEILATCKQVNAEAADMLPALWQDRQLPLDIKLQVWHLTLWQQSYHVEVYYNGKMLGRGTQGDQTLQVQWPPCLAKVQSSNINITLHDFSQGRQRISADEQELVCRTADLQVNYVLYNLYRFLRAGKSLQGVSVKILTEYSNEYLEEMLSPICALSGMVENPSITVTSFQMRSFQIDPALSQALRDAASGFRRLHSLEQKAMRLKESTDNRLSQNPSSSTSLHSPRMHSLHDALACCKRVTSVCELEGIYQFASDKELEEAISFIERHLRDTEHNEDERRVSETSIN